MTPLEEIPDIEGFVRWQAKKFTKGLPVMRIEEDELYAEGIAILYALHDTWEPSRGKFLTYVTTMFQRRLIDWYRKEIISSGNGHIRQKENGVRIKRKIQYHSMASLDAPTPSGEVHAFSQDPGLVHYDATS